MLCCLLRLNSSSRPRAEYFFGSLLYYIIFIIFFGGKHKNVIQELLQDAARLDKKRRSRKTMKISMEERAGVKRGDGGGKR